MSDLPILAETGLTFNDAPQLIWIRVRDAGKLLWDKNPKLHDIGSLAQSIQKHGFQEIPKFDITLNGIKAGNGRVECLALMEEQGQGLPRGLAQETATGIWAMPLLIGTDAKSLALAESYAIDSNNLTLTGGDFTAFDLQRLWNEDTYQAILQELAAADELPVSVTGEDLDALLAPPTDPTKEWQGMPEFHQEDKNAFRTILVHFTTAEDVEKFGQLLQQTITDETKYLWFPRQEKNVLKDLVYKDES